MIWMIVLWLISATAAKLTATGDVRRKYYSTQRWEIRLSTDDYTKFIIEISNNYI